MFWLITVRFLIFISVLMVYFYLCVCVVCCLCSCSCCVGVLLPIVWYTEFYKEQETQFTVRLCNQL
jgi:hypothetical protein